MVLAAGSDYFRAAFDAGMAESGSARVEVRCVAPELMDAAITFIYSGECCVCSKSLSGLLKLAGRLQAVDLQDAAVASVLARLEPVRAQYHA